MEKENVDNQTHEEEKKTDELKDDEKKVDLTQSELDALIVRTKNKVKDKYSDYDDIKAKAEAADQAAEEARLAKLDEVEKANEIATKKDEELKAANDRIATMEKAEKDRKLTKAFETAAAAANIPKEYLADAKVLAGISGETEVEKIEEIVKQLVADRPYLVKVEKQQREIGGASNGGGGKTEKTSDEILAEYAAKARKTQRWEDKVAYANMKRQLKG
ncbi:Uncharacterized protein BCRIVMBC845_06482 [Bacillus cereus]|nr:Uncharacterized protein BCRIVMBC845_06482 [Bacillus cereus]